MKWSIFSILVLFLAGCASPAGEPAAPQAASAAQQETPVSNLPDYGVAPEMTNDIWLNSSQPLRLAGLQGKVVLLDMWTFGCINCQHVIPSLKGWYEKYSAQGLEVIGNHYPEFGYERDLNNLKAALAQYEIPYPVAQDNDGKTWSAYHNRFWPSLYLIDKHGHIRYQHIGEGAYDETESAIRSLLAESYP